MITDLWRKDWQLLRGLIAGFLALHVIAELSAFLLRHHPAAGEARAAFDVLPVLAWPLLLVWLVHQDAPQATRQDWLTRPVPRLPLLMGKVLFVVLFIQLPVFVIDLAGNLLQQPPGNAFIEAWVRTTFLFLCVSLPSLALGALTRSLPEALVTGLLIVVVPNIGSLGMSLLFGEPRHGGRALALSATVAIAAVLVLALQYLRRHTVWPARAVATLAALLTGVLMGLP